MRVVQLDRGLVREIVKAGEFLEMPPDEVLQRGRGEEILLPKAQLLAGRCGVGRIEDLGDGFGPHPIRHGPDMVALVEGVEAQGIAGPRRPEPQGIDVLAAPADDRRVVSHGFHGLGRMPDVTRLVGVARDRLDAAPEADVIGDLGPGEFPRIAEAQPVLGVFLLPSVLDHLPEQPVLVADPVAIGRHRQGRHALHETGGEAAEATVPERSVGLHLAQRVEVDAELRKGLAHGLHEAEIGQGVEHEPTDQELQRHVIDALGADRVGLFVGLLPALDHAVPDRQRGCEKPVALARIRGRLAHRIGELGQDGCLQIIDATAGPQFVIGQRLCRDLYQLELIRRHP